MQKLRAGVVTRVLAVAALTGLTLLGAVSVQAQSQSQNAAQNWPSKPVMLMVGSLAGSAPEVYARTVSEPMSRILGQPVLVEVRAGANGNVAAEFVASAPADGYAIWIPAQSQIEINPSAYDQLRWKPSDFTGVIKGGEAPLVLVVHPSVPARNLAELVAWVKACAAGLLADSDRPAAYPRQQADADRHHRCHTLASIAGGADPGRARAEGYGHHHLVRHDGAQCHAA